MPVQQHRDLKKKLIRQMRENCHMYLNLLPNQHGTPPSLCNPSTHWPLFPLAHCDRLHLTTAEITVLPTQSQTPFPGGSFGLGGSSTQECPREFCRGLLQGNWYWKHKGKAAFPPTPINQDLSTDSTGQHFWQYFSPGLKERQGPECHCGARYQRTQVCIYVQQQECHPTTVGVCRCFWAWRPPGYMVC